MPVSFRPGEINVNIIIRNNDQTELNPLHQQGADKYWPKIKSEQFQVLNSNDLRSSVAKWSAYDRLYEFVCVTYIFKVGITNMYVSLLYYFLLFIYFISIFLSRTNIHFWYPLGQSVSARLRQTFPPLISFVNPYISNIIPLYIVLCLYYNYLVSNIVQHFLTYASFCW